MATVKKLYRSKDNRIFAGIIGGIAEYFNVDPTLLRLFWLLILLVSGVIPALIAYLLAILIVPKRA